MSLSYLVATDLSSRSDRAMARAFDLAQRNGASMHVVSVIDNAAPNAMVADMATGAQRLIERQCDKLGASVSTQIHVVTGDPTADTLRLIEQTEPDMVIMGTHRDRSFFDALRETTAQRITRLTPYPVLIAKKPAEMPYVAVLAAMDYSPAATAALRMAANLAPEASVTPLHVLHVPYGGMLAKTPDGQTTLERSFRAEAARFDATWRATETLPDTVGETLVETGAPFSIIAQLSRRQNIDLIALGAHGRIGGRRPILGSLALDLMREPPCDLLIGRDRP